MFYPHPQLPARVRSQLHSSEFLRRKVHFPAETIARVLRYAAPLGSLIEMHESLPRCMGRLKEMICEGDGSGTPLPSGTVVAAGQLRESCGRFDREWHAPAGGFWMAVAWADTLLPDFARFLPMAAGIASCETVRACEVEASIKWVNDVHVAGRKIAGVLCETISGSSPGDRYHLIGIGINCNNLTFPTELKETATSILRERGSEISLELFTVELLANLAWNFGLVHLHEEQSLARQGVGGVDVPRNPVVEAWKGLSDTIGRKVVYGYDVVRNPLYRGVVREIDQDGGLVMQLEDGSFSTENSGEIIYLDE